MTNSRPRPISPHLQIYRPQLTAVLSSLHRLSGLFLSAAAVGLAGWVITLGLGESIFASAQQFLSSGYGAGLIALGLFGFFYHLLMDSVIFVGIGDMDTTSKMSIGPDGWSLRALLRRGLLPP
jgi:succinate dehydrogenase cytochrome b556 subunit